MRTFGFSSTTATSLTLSLALATAALAACGGGVPGGPGPASPGGSEAPSASPSASTAPSTGASSGAPSAIPSGATTPPKGAGTPVLKESTMSKDLEALGLDPKKLPRLEKIEPAKLRKLMVTFTKSLGVGCKDCHSDDFKAPTPQKKVAKRMWNDFVVALQREDGKALYCDSCHQGKEHYLDRSDKKALGAWMQTNVVGSLKRSDGKEHGCETCHGDPFNGDFLDAWKK